MGTHPIFESDFDCLTDSGYGANNRFGIIVGQSFAIIRIIPGVKDKVVQALSDLVWFVV